MKNKDNLDSVLFIILITSLIFFAVYKGAIESNLQLQNEVEYKNKIIEREYGRNFESYEDYLLFRIEKGS